MKCKFCNTELKPGDPICPKCHENNAGKDGGAWKIVLITAASVLLVVALVFVVLIGSNVIQFNAPNTATEPSEQPSEPAAQGTEPAEPKDLVSYSATDDAQAEAAVDNVVAEAGGVKLTNAELQSYYWMNVYQFLADNSYYLSYFGIDLSKPLDQQVYDNTQNTTWQQAFLDYALEVWHRYTIVAKIAEQEGFTLSDEAMAYVNNMPDQARQMATEYGYASVDEMLYTEMGPGATLDGYIGYMATNFIALQYMENAYEALKPTLEEIEAYYQKNESTFAENDASKEDGDVVDVRHILILPEGGKEDEQGNVTYNEQEYADCYEKAKQILDQWKAGDATEASFAELAKQHSEDPGSKSKGGLYTDVKQGRMVSAFDAWIFDESRQFGDTDLVKTEIGYHIMFFVEREPAWQRTAESMIISDKLQAKVEAGMESWPAEVYYDQIVLGEVTLVGKEE